MNADVDHAIHMVKAEESVPWVHASRSLLALALPAARKPHPVVVLGSIVKLPFIDIKSTKGLR